MRQSQKVGHSQKIYNCIDELLMQDTDFSTKNWKIQNQKQFDSSNGFKRTNNKQKTNFSKRSKLSKTKSLSIRQKKSLQKSQQTNKKLNENNKISNLMTSDKVQSNHMINVFNQKGQKFSSNKNISNLQNLSLKKTFSYQLQQLKIDQIKQTKQEIDWDSQNNDSIFTNQGASPNSLLSPHSKVISGFNSAIKTSQIKLNTLSLDVKGKRPSYLLPKQRKQSLRASVVIKPLNLTNNKVSQQPTQSKQSPQFCLTHEQLEFLTLLYPEQSPQQLMVKLLLYYEQELQFKNSFQQVAYQQCRQNKNYFFKSKRNLQKLSQQSKTKGSYANREVKDIYSEQCRFNKDERQQENEPFIKLDASQTNNSQIEYNQYTKLKQQCLAALGSQMVATQIKNSLVQTANVNYYTRQYAMPHIMDFIQQKTQQSNQKIAFLQKRHKIQQQKSNQPVNYSNKNQVNKSKFVGTAQSIQSHFNLNNLPDSFIHKVYIPANSRGQAFDMDYQPDPKLFDYLPQNDYRRILRDVNHLIQKVLLYHRHNSFLKKKNNVLCKGWNLVLFLVLFSILILLYIESSFVLQAKSSYIEIVIFFCLLFMIILILGNAFNNYKKSVKRSSLIKDICQQITNYLEFINCSSKNVKWILGKDFFWLQVWIYVVKNNRHT